MKTFWIGKVIKIIFFVALLVTVMSVAVMMLWNWLMPTLLNASEITFWQALGILALAKLLFGVGRHGWGTHHQGHTYWKSKMENRLKGMSPEERDRFRENWKKRCGTWKHFDWDEKKEEGEVKIDG